MENKGRKWFLIIASFVLALAILVGVGYAALFEKQNSQDIESVASDYKQEEEENYAKRALKILGEEAVVPKELSGAETLLVPSDFVNGYKEGLFNNRKATCNVSAKFSREDRLLLCFEAQTEIEYCEIKVEVYNAYNKLEKKATFYANTQLSVYYFPITGIASISKITFSASSGNGGVTVKRCTLLNNKEVLVPEYLSGAFVVDEVKNIVSKNPDVQIQSVIDTVCDQNYLYTVSNNKLTVCSLANPQRPTKIGSLEGIGLPRRVIIVKNNLLAVACLEYGVYLIDVSNPRTPKIAGHIEALEFSSGMDSKGDYLFIASRYSGIEVFNIADPANPNLCTVFRSNTEAERIDCEVYEDFLYVSIHSPNRIEIFDIGEVLNPRFIGSVATDGTPYGIDTYKDKLVVSTGYSSTKSKNDTIEDIGYGMGHAIELYDLKYPERPSFISLAKADGRYHRSTADYWNVRVSGNYAYHTDMHNGLYVVDLSNPKNPVRLCEMRVSYSSESERYSNIDGANSLFNFDTTKELRGCITGAAIYNGYVYVGESTGGIHVMKYDVAEYAFRDSVVMFKEGDAPSDKKYSKRYLDVTKKKFEGQTFVVEEIGDYLFVGTSKGIAVLDRDMNQKNFYKTNGAVRDLKVIKSRLYAAESEAGVSVYSVSGSNITKIGGHKPPNRSGRIPISTQIAVSPDGRYIITNFCTTDVVIIDAADLRNMVIMEKVKISSIFQRNIGQGHMSGNTVFVSHSLGMIEIVFNEDGTITQKEQDNPTSAVVGVFAKRSENTVLSIGNDGYRIIDVTNGYKRYRLGDLVRVSNLLLDGLPTIKDDTLVVTNPSSGNVGIIDITNTTRPQLTGIINVVGTVDRAFIASDNAVYVPARYEGLIKIVVTD